LRPVAVAEHVGGGADDTHPPRTQHASSPHPVSSACGDQPATEPA
jgi:hypothetical protein